MYQRSNGEDENPGIKIEIHQVIQQNVGGFGCGCWTLVWLLLLFLFIGWFV